MGILSNILTSKSHFYQELSREAIERVLVRIIFSPVCDSPDNVYFFYPAGKFSLEFRQEYFGKCLPFAKMIKKAKITNNI